jgi:hypothetical protein
VRHRANGRGHGQGHGQYGSTRYPGHYMEQRQKATKSTSLPRGYTKGTIGPGK